MYREADALPFLTARLASHDDAALADARSRRVDDASLRGEVGRLSRCRLNQGRLPCSQSSHMAPLIPELARDDVRGVFDGELVDFREGLPYFPLVIARMLHRKRDIPVAFAVFDVLVLDGEPTTNLPYARRRELLETLDLGGGFWFVPPAFDDGAALFAATCEQGLEGVVAKRRDSDYRPGERGWVKVKNRSYWRFHDERQLAQSRRRTRLTI
jgi:hypothetical protein